jgi:RHS repeat-associated protein
MRAAFKMQIDRNENKRNRLASVTRNTLAYAAYTYNALEQLTSRNTSAVGAPAGTVHYLYDQDGHLIAEANAATGTITRDYIWLASNDNDPIDLPLAIAESATLTMVHADHLGRPNRMTDAAKATVWQATWKPWGEIHQLSGTLTQNLRYPGQYFQIETGLHYNHHRHYDPITGRYTQPDPLRFVDGPSVYAYASSSPFMYTDREGLDHSPMHSGITDALRSLGIPVDQPQSRVCPAGPIPSVPSTAIDRPSNPGGGNCTCKCRAGDANSLSSIRFAQWTDKSCAVAAQKACSIANARSAASHQHHLQAKCSDGSNRSGSGSFAQ